MKILIISTHFPPMNSVGALRPYSFAKRWSQIGHDVTVLTVSRYEIELGLDFDCSPFRVISVPLPYLYRIFAKKIRKNGKYTFISKNKTNKNKYRKSILYWFDKFRSKTGILKDQRMPSHLDPWYFSAYPLVSKEKWDLVLSTYSPYVAHLIGYRLKKRKKTRFWIADYRDLWTVSHMFTGIWPLRLIEKRLENKIINVADQVTTVSAPLADCLIDTFKIKNVAVVENGFDKDDLKKLPLKEIFYGKKIRIVYTGSIYPFFQDLSPFFRAMSRIKNSKNSFLLTDLEIIFAGNNEKTVFGLAKENEVDEFVRCLGKVCRTEALRMQRDAHVLLFLGGDNLQDKGIVTGKLFEYINSGTEIWGVGVTEKSTAGKLILDSECGNVFGSDVLRLEEKLIELLQRKTKHKIIGKSNIINNYDRSKLADRMLSLIELG